MKKKKLIFLWLSLILFFPTVISAETILLKSGKKIEGKILEKTGEYVKIEVNGSPLYYELKYVLSIKADEADSSLYFKKGLEFASEAKFKEAEDEFKKGLAIKPTDHNLGEVLKIIDDLKKGLIKEDYAIYLFKGSNYLIDKQYQQAIKEFKEALRLKPDDLDLYYYLGICNHKLKQYQQALPYLQKAIEKESNDELYYYLGACYYHLGQLTEAITYLKKTIQINPDDAEAYSLLGISNYFLGRVGLARENLYKAKELFQKKGDYLNSREVEDFLSKLE